MGTNTSPRALQSLILCLLALAVSSCGKQAEPEADPAEGAVEAAAQMESDKVPLTTSSAEARAEFNKGQGLLDDLHFTEARPHFRRAVELDPEFAMAHVLMANTSFTTAQFFDSLALAEASAAGASEGEQLIIAALVANADNDQAAQLAALKSLVSMYPKDERSHNRLATYYFGIQDYDNAILHFGHAIAINPEFATAYNLLGYSYRSKDELEAAKGAFEMYIELIPGEANPYDSYAELLMEMGHYDDAIDNYNKALEIDTHFGGSYAGLSVAESLKGDAAAAQEAASAMLSAARNTGEVQAAMFRKITSHLFAGDIDAAIAVSEEQAAMNEADGDLAAMGGTIEYMGDIMLHQDNADKAREYYDAALAYRQQSSINEANKAQAARAHQFKLAVAAMVDEQLETATEIAASYTAAVEAEGTNFERRRAHELAGYLALMNEDSATAVAELARGTQLNPIVLYWSAVASQGAGDMEAAIALAERAANRNTLSANMPFARADALKLLEDLSM